MKHCKDSLPHMVAGSLLGLDQKGVLEITHSFPLPLSKSDAADAGAVEAAAAEEFTDGDEYQVMPRRRVCVCAPCGLRF